jgi:hypothetical protein
MDFCRGIVGMSWLARECVSFAPAGASCIEAAAAVDPALTGVRCPEDPIPTAGDRRRRFSLYPPGYSGFMRWASMSRSSIMCRGHTAGLVVAAVGEPHR